MAIYDATIAAWESKYFYDWVPLGELDPSLKALFPHRAAPPIRCNSGGCGGGAVAFFPNEASAFRAMAEEAAQSRLQAGVEFPSDLLAGRELGRRVAMRVIERAKADGSNAVWKGTVPSGRVSGLERALAMQQCRIGSRFSWRRRTSSGRQLHRTASRIS